MSIKTHLLQHLSWKWDKNSFGGDVSFRRLFSKRVLSLGFVTFHFSFLLLITFTSSAAVADCPGGAVTLQSLLLVVTLLCLWWVGWEGIFHFVPQWPCSPPRPTGWLFARAVADIWANLFWEWDAWRDMQRPQISRGQREEEAADLKPNAVYKDKFISSEGRKSWKRDTFLKREERSPYYPCGYTSTL